LYVPVTQAALDRPSAITFSLLVRTTDPVEPVAMRLRTALRAVDADVPLIRVTSFDQLYGRQIRGRRFYVVFLSLFAALAALLAAVGVYGVVSYVVGLRTREIGIRLALGARPVQVKTLVVRQGLQPVLAGILAGLGGAWWLTGALTSNPVFRSQLFQVLPHDTATLAITATGFLVVGLAACWIPAHRAAHVDPVSVLRTE
jgi:ABC-type antimicrobial peptide transport system permease subunit